MARRLTARGLVAEAIGGLTSWDHALGRTLTGLWRNPGGFAQTWLEGDRKRHVGPGRLLVWSIALFALVHAICGLSVLETSGIRFTASPDPAGGSGASAEIAEEPGSSTGEPDAEPSAGQRVIDETTRLASRWIQPLLLLALPMLAAVVHRLYRGYGRGFVDCLVLVAYVEASLFFLRTLLLPLFLASRNDAELLRFVLTIYWGTRAGRQFFGVGVWSALWRELVARALTVLLTAVLFGLLLIPVAWLRVG